MKRLVTIGAVVALAVLAVLVLGRRSGARQAADGGTIRYNGAQPPKSLNAYVDNSSGTATTFDLLYEKLLDTDPETTDLVPALAERWTVSDDGASFTFFLDPAARWSDGVPVTAEDVKWTFDAVMAPKSDTGPWKGVLAFFESPEVLDARTVRFRKRGDSPRDWRDILNCATFWVLPRHVFGDKDFNRLEMVGAVTGGPYAIRRVEDQVETELVRRPGWWRRDRPACKGRYNFERILIRYYADQENAFEAFKQRKIDVYPVYTARIYAEETGGEKFRRNWILKRKVKNHAPIGFQGFAMNMRRFPFDDVRVRRAMAALVDRETMNRTMMNGAYFLLSSYYQDIYDDAHPCPNERHRYDPEKAAKLLAEAGWRRDPADGRLKKDGRAFEFTFLSRSGTEDKFLSLFDQALRAQGISMTIARNDFAGWMREMDAFNFDMTWAAWGAGIVKYPEIAWSGKEADRKGSNNVTGFKSAEVDRLIAEEKGMTRAEDRLAAYRKIDALIAAEVPYVLLWQTDSTRLLYWNKFGMPSGVLTKYEREDCVLSTWWYDEDRADELSRAISENGFLPTVSETVRYEASHLWAVEGISRGERLRASSHGPLSQPQEPAVVSTEARGTHTMVNSTTTVCTGSNGRMSAGADIDRTGKNRYNNQQQLVKAKKGTPRNGKRNSSQQADWCFLIWMGVVRWSSLIHASRNVYVDRA